MEITPIGIAIGLIVPLIGGLIAFAVARYNAYRTASAKFRDAVLRELSDFYPVMTRWRGAGFGRELSAKFPALQAAVDDFLPNITWYKRASFRKAWIKYCSYSGDASDINTYTHYFDAYSTGTQAQATAKAQALFHANVKHLLSFAHEN